MLLSKDYFRLARLIMIECIKQIKFKTLQYDIRISSSISELSIASNRLVTPTRESNDVKAHDSAEITIATIFKHKPADGLLSELSTVAKTVDVKGIPEKIIAIITTNTALATNAVTSL